MTPKPEMPKQDNPLPINVTIEKFLPTWFDHLLANRTKHLYDLSLFSTDKPISRIVFLATGPSASTYTPKPGDFIIGNQTSYRTYDPSMLDLIVITDAYPDMLKKLKESGSPKHMTFAIADICAPNLFDSLSVNNKVYAFHHPVNRSNPYLKLIFSKLYNHNLKTGIIQCGNSMNAAILIAAQLIQLKKLPLVPFHLAGVDFALADGTQTPEFQWYAEDNKAIVQYLQSIGIQFTMEKTPGPLKEYISEV